MLVRRLARPLLAGFFLARGVRLLRTPEEGVPAAERAGRLTGALTFLPQEPLALVRLNAGVQTGAGLLLATGRLPRVAALTLAGSALPTAVARHPFWQETDPEVRETEKAALISELSIIGGLLLAAVDTGGDPSLAWRARHAARRTQKATGHAVRASRREAKLAGSALKGHAVGMREKLPV